MYQYTYDEVLADSPVDARMQERAVLDHAIALLRAAEGQPGSAAEQQALGFTTEMWSLFIKDLAHPDNDLPREVRANLISIGLWCMSEICRIRDGQSCDVKAIAEVCGLIRDGLD